MKSEGSRQGYNPNLRLQEAEITEQIGLTGRKYLGRICPHGHEHEKTGKGLRYIYNHDCVVCARQRTAARDRRLGRKAWPRVKRHRKKQVYQKITEAFAAYFERQRNTPTQQRLEAFMLDLLAVCKSDREKADNRIKTGHKPSGSIQGKLRVEKGQAGLPSGVRFEPLGKSRVKRGSDGDTSNESRTSHDKPSQSEIDLIEIHDILSGKEPT